MSLVALCIITAAIILTIPSSIVMSLGMVGALSIVRFRTAVKNPIDLVFLFWSISVGIICGAGLSMIAFLSSAVLVVVLLILDKVPLSSSPLILVMSYAQSTDTDSDITDTIKKYVAHYNEKARVNTCDVTELTIEIITKPSSYFILSKRYTWIQLYPRTPPHNSSEATYCWSVSHICSVSVNSLFHTSQYCFSSTKSE